MNRQFHFAIRSRMRSYLSIGGLVLSASLGAHAEDACTKDAKICADGSVVVRSGPSCAFAECGGISAGRLSAVGDSIMCTMDAKICPDGSAVGRSGPGCSFAPCPDAAAPAPAPTASPDFAARTQSVANISYQNLNSRCDQIGKQFGEAKRDACLQVELRNRWDMMASQFNSMYDTQFSCADSATAFKTVSGIIQKEWDAYWPKASAASKKSLGGYVSRYQTTMNQRNIERQKVCPQTSPQKIGTAFFSLADTDAKKMLTGCGTLANAKGLCLYLNFSHRWEDVRGKLNEFKTLSSYCDAKNDDYDTAANQLMSDYNLIKDQVRGSYKQMLQDRMLATRKWIVAANRQRQADCQNGKPAMSASDCSGSAVTQRCDKSFNGVPGICTGGIRQGCQAVNCRYVEDATSVQTVCELKMAVTNVVSDATLDIARKPSVIPIACSPAAPLMSPPRDWGKLVDNPLCKSIVTQLDAAKASICDKAQADCMSACQSNPGQSCFMVPDPFRAGVSYCSAPRSTCTTCAVQCANIGVTCKARLDDKSFSDCAQLTNPGGSTGAGAAQ